ncbi:MAG: phage gp6-like head-tail connector protein [Oscillospiraceae bacterium]|nr:phage gp6-like head-tail connector protein [Oscillospiraceae bacterium]
MVTVDSLRQYLNCSPDTTAAQLSMWLDAAKSEARTAGIPEFQRNAQYDLFIYALAAWYYDNRGLQVSGSYQATARETMQKIKDAFVLQLRYATEDPEKDEEGGDGS